MRLTIIVGLSVSLAYFITGRFSPSNQLQLSAERGASMSAERLFLQDMPLSPLPTEYERNFIGNSLGVVTFGGVPDLRDHWKRLYNDNGSLWFEFSLYDSELNYEEIRSKLQPFALNPDYFVLALKCVAIEQDRWKVIVDEASGLTKYVRKDDAAFRFQSWGEYSRDAGCFVFNHENNGVRVNPDGDEIAVPQGADYFHAHGVAVSSEWIKIKWDEQNSADATMPAGAGWVRWRQNDRILTEFGPCC